MPDIKFCYADTNDFRDWIAGSNFASTWSTDTGVIRRILEAASRRMDAYIGGDSLNTFGPVVQTRTYDLGKHSYLRNDPRSVGPLMTIEPRDTVINQIPLGGWLSSLTSVTVYDDTERSGSTSWTEGVTNDFLLVPYNSQPYFVLKVNEDTTKSLYGGQKTLAVAGTWGWSNTSTTPTTLNGGINDSVTTVTVTAATDIGEGSTIRVGTEQMFVSTISSNDLTVVRGVHGTTAAAHTNGDDVEKISFNSVAQQVCLDLAHIIYRDRDLGFNDRQESPTTVDTHTALSSLDQFVAHTQTSGVLF